MFTFYCHPIFHYSLPIHASHHPACSSMHSQCCPQVWNQSQASPQPICHNHHVAHYQGKLCPKHAHLANAYAARNLSTPAQQLHGQVSQANDQLEHFMEDAESFFVQLDRFPQLQQTTKQLVKHASQLRKQEPSLDKDSVAAYQTAVKNFEQESRAKLQQLKEELVACKKALVGLAEAPAKMQETSSNSDALSNPSEAIEAADDCSHASATSHPEASDFVQRNQAQEQVEKAEKKLIDAFGDLSQSRSYSYADLLASRQAFWTEHRKNLHAQDLEGFQKKTEKHQAIDDELISFAMQHQECQNHLDLIDACKRDISALHYSQDILGVLQSAERHATMRLIKELHQAALFFQEHGYLTITEHYHAVLEEFLDLVENCTNFDAGVNQYLQEWTKRENEMSANQEHFEVLHETEMALSEFAEEFHSPKLEAQLQALCDRKGSLKDSYDIERFIQDAQRLMQ